MKTEDFKFDLQAQLEAEEIRIRLISGLTQEEIDSITAEEYQNLKDELAKHEEQKKSTSTPSNPV